MHSPAIRYKAETLRRNGNSLHDIVKILGVNKSTVSFWCRDISLTESAIQKIAKQTKNKVSIGLLRYSERIRKERVKNDINLKKMGARMIGEVSGRDIFTTGLGLYWGEGYKNGEFGFTNSNPDIISFYLKWLKFFDVSKDGLIFRLTINQAFQREENKIINFWIRLLNVKREQFSQTTRIRTDLKKASMKNKNNYKGILRVKVRNGLSLRHKVLGAIGHIYKNS